MEQVFILYLYGTHGFAYKNVSFTSTRNKPHGFLEELWVALVGKERVSDGSATIFISCEDTLGVLTSFKHTDEIY